MTNINPGHQRHCALIAPIVREFGSFNTKEKDPLYGFRQMALQESYKAEPK